MLAGAEVLAGADGVGADEVVIVPGTETVTPAALQVFSTPEMTAAWSVVEHAFWTQGVTDEIRVSNFLQWQAKSVNWAQPSELKGVRKHESYFKSSVLAS